MAKNNKRKIQEPGVYKRKGTNQLYYVNPKNKQMQGYGSWDEFKSRGYDKSSIKGEVEEDELNEYMWNVEEPVIGKDIDPKTAKNQLGIGSIGSESNFSLPKQPPLDEGDKNLQENLKNILEGQEQGKGEEKETGIGDQTTGKGSGIQIDLTPNFDFPFEQKLGGKGSQIDLTPNFDFPFEQEPGGKATTEEEGAKKPEEGTEAPEGETQKEAGGLDTERIKSLYKEKLGENYKPGKEQSWDDIAKWHKEHGTTEKQLNDWLDKPSTKEAAKRTIAANEKKINEDVNKATKKAKVGDEKSKTTAKQLIEAGLSVNDTAKILATTRDKVQKWSKQKDDVEQNFWGLKNEYMGGEGKGRQTIPGDTQEEVNANAKEMGINPDNLKPHKKVELEQDITNAENEMINFIEKDKKLVNTFKDFAKQEGLNELDSTIDEVDKKIQDKIEERDEILTDLSGKTIPQWMLSGEKKLATQRLNNEISQLQNRKQSAVNQYNRAYDRVITKVGFKSKDLKQKAKDLQNKINLYEGKQDRVNKELSERLKEEKEAYTEEKERIIKNLQAEIAPTAADVARETQKLKNRKKPEYKYIEGWGMFYTDGKGNIELVANEPEGVSSSDLLTKSRKIDLSAIGIPNDQSNLFAKMLSQYPGATNVEDLGSSQAWNKLKERAINAGFESSDISQLKNNFESFVKYFQKSDKDELQKLTETLIEIAEH